MSVAPIDVQTIGRKQAKAGRRVTTGVVLDAGAFIALERRDRTMVALAKRFVNASTPLATSAWVVAQVWRGGDRHQVPIAHLLRRTTAP